MAGDVADLENMMDGVCCRGSWWLVRGRLPHYEGVKNLAPMKWHGASVGGSSLPICHVPRGSWHCQGGNWQAQKEGWQKVAGRSKRSPGYVGPNRNKCGVCYFMIGPPSATPRIHLRWLVAKLL